MQSQIDSLQDELAVVKSELVQVKTELGIVKRALQRLSTGSGGYSEAVSVTESEELRAPSSAARDPVSAATGRVAETPASRASDLTWEEREEVAVNVGRFLRRSLNEDHRGTSGRDAIPLASRYWIVVRDISGTVYDPVRVFARWTPAAALVKRGSSCGNSIFVGLPSQREINCALRAGSFAWGGHIES